MDSAATSAADGIASDRLDLIRPLFTEQRQELYLAHLGARGGAQVSELSGLFGVSMSTVRRDLQELEDAGLVRRVHGGAVLVAERPERAEAAAMQRVAEHAAHKQRIGAMAAGLVQDGSTIIITGGHGAAAPRRVTVLLSTRSCPGGASTSRRPSSKRVRAGHGPARRDGAPPHAMASALVVLGYPDVDAAGSDVPAVVAPGPSALEGIDHRLVELERNESLADEAIAELPPGRVLADRAVLQQRHQDTVDRAAQGLVDQLQAIFFFFFFFFTQPSAYVSFNVHHAPSADLLFTSSYTFHRCIVVAEVFVTALNMMLARSCPNCGVGRRVPCDRQHYLLAVEYY